MPLPTPLDLKQFYILLALAGGSRLHGYAIYQQIIDDSNQSLYLSFTSLYRLLRIMTAKGLIEVNPYMTYALTPKGRQRLLLEAGDLHDATAHATARLNH